MGVRWTIGREREREESACLMTRFMIHSGFSIAFDTLRHAFRFEWFALRLTASQAMEEEEVGRAPLPSFEFRRK